MRVVGKHRKNKVEGPRVVGFGLMIAGSMALVLSVAGAAGAGSSKAAEPAHHQCAIVYKQDGPIAQILQWQLKNNCQQNTSTTWHTTTTQKTSCTCSTTTTLPETTTSEQVAGSTVDVDTSTTASTTSSSTSTTATTTTMNNLVGPTTTDDVPDVVQGDTSTTSDEGITVSGNTVGTVGPQIAVSPETAELPFTGSNTTPLAVAGVVMVATGFGLSRRKRRLAN